MPYKLTILTIALAAITGCASLHKSSTPKRDFPAWANAQCHGALNAAHDAIASKGAHLSANSLRVEVIPGQKKFGNQWGWYVAEPSWPDGGMYVGGLTSGDGRLVQIVIDPARTTDPTAIQTGSLVHEMAHHWLICNGHGTGHPALYDDVIPGWAANRAVVGASSGDLP